MTFSEAYNELYPREEAKQEKPVEDEKMVEDGADGAGCAGVEDGEQ